MNLQERIEQATRNFQEALVKIIRGMTLDELAAKPERGVIKVGGVVPGPCLIEVDGKTFDLKPGESVTVGLEDTEGKKSRRPRVEYAKMAWKDLVEMAAKLGVEYPHNTPRNKLVQQIQRARARRES